MQIIVYVNHIVFAGVINGKFNGREVEASVRKREGMRCALIVDAKNFSIEAPKAIGLLYVEGEIV